MAPIQLEKGWAGAAATLSREQTTQQSGRARNCLSLESSSFCSLDCNNVHCNAATLVLRQNACSAALWQNACSTAVATFPLQEEAELTAGSPNRVGLAMLEKLAWQGRAESQNLGRTSLLPEHPRVDRLFYCGSHPGCVSELTKPNRSVRIDG